MNKRLLFVGLILLWICILISNNRIGAQVPREPSIVYLEGNQLMVRKRLADGSLDAPKPYIIKGVTWQPATRAPQRGPNPTNPSQEVDYGFFFDWPGRCPQGREIFNYWLKKEFLPRYSTDIALMKKMDVNTVRIYTDFYNDFDAEIERYREILDELYRNDIMVVMTVAGSRKDLEKLVDLEQEIFNIYTDYNDPENHFYPSGWMGDYTDLDLTENFTDDTTQGTTAIKISYTAQNSQGQGWAGIYWQYPENNWGERPGYNLSGYTHLVFEAKGENGGEKITIKVGGITGDTVNLEYGPIELSNQWQIYKIDLQCENLSNIAGGFGVVFSSTNGPQTVYLDRIYYGRYYPNGHAKYRYEKVVELLKNHPAILMWSLGNEWNLNRLYDKDNPYSGLQEAAEAVNQAAKKIKEIDPNHLVTSSLADFFDRCNSEEDPCCNPNFDFWLISDCVRLTPNVDVWGINVYRGESFGNLFLQWENTSSKPFYLSEFGTDSFQTTTWTNITCYQVDDCQGEEDQEMQSDIDVGLWRQIEENLSAFFPNKKCLGGFVHEFNDELWKVGSFHAGLGYPQGFEWRYQNNTSYGEYTSGGFYLVNRHPDNVANEEYFGMVNADREPKEVFYRLGEAYARAVVREESFVSEEGNDTTGDGSLENPWKSIQYAIIHTTEQVNVLSGVYKENIDFLGKNIALIGIEGAEKTVIDGQNQGSVVRFVSGESSAIIAGFTIQGGSDSGIYCEGATVQVLNNIIKDNRANFGAAINALRSNVFIAGNRIIQNTSSTSAAVSLNNSSGVIERNMIENNVARGSGVSIAAGIELMNNSSPIIRNNIIANNREGCGIKAFLPQGATPRIINNTIADNDRGGIELAYFGDVSIKNNIITGNHSYGIYVDSGKIPSIKYNDVWQNSLGNYGGICPDKTGTEGNISVDPNFVLAGVNYHLQPNSPCIDTGDPTDDFSREPQPNGGRINMGAYGNTPEATSKIDTTAPTTPVVTDEGNFTESKTTLSASWSSQDLESGISEYQYGIGTSKGATDVLDWQTTQETTVTLSNLNLERGKTYYFSVRAKNGVGLWSGYGYSDGIMVIPVLEVSTKEVNLVITKDESDWITFKDAFQITNLSNILCTWQLINNQDATYTPLGGEPEPMVAQGFGFYEVSGGIGAGSTVSIRAYVNNDKPAGVYQGSYTLQEKHQDKVVDVAVIRYILIIKDPFSPLIRFIWPRKTYPGRYIWIVGKNFGLKQDTNKVIFIGSRDNKNGQIIYWSRWIIVCKVPELTAGRYQVKVVTENGESNPIDFTILEVKPRIRWVWPWWGRGGTKVTIYGQGFGKKASDSRVLVYRRANSKYAYIISWSDRKIVFRMPYLTGRGWYKIKVLTYGGESNPRYFYYY